MSAPLDAAVKAAAAAAPFVNRDAMLRIIEAAAPPLAAAERERCARLATMTAENFADDPCMTALRKFAALLREQP